MSDFDKTLEALASLCPQNIPEIENLPVPSLEIGDQCLLIWSDQIEVWRVKGFCADDGVDIVYDKFNAHMEVPRSELRLIGDFFNARQEEIDDLKNQLNNMEACYIEKKKELEDQHKKVDEVLEYLDGESANRWGLWKEKADMLDQGASNAFEEAYWMVKKTLRGAND